MANNWPDNWRAYGKDTVAGRLARAEVPSFMGLIRQGFVGADGKATPFRGGKVVVGPGEAAVLIKEGKVESVITEDSAKVVGVWDRILSWLFVSKELEVIYVDISPFEIPIYLGSSSANDQGSSQQRIVTSDEVRTTSTKDAASVELVALSRDREIITAECRLRVRVALDNIIPFTGLMRDRLALARWDLAAMVRGQLVGPVLPSLIAAHNAADFRGSSVIGEQIAAEAKGKIEEGLAAWGIVLDAFSIAWGLTDAERLQIKRNREMREDDEKAFDQRRILMDLQREQEIRKAKLINLQEYRIAELKAENEVSQFTVRAELDEELMKEGQRPDLAKIDAAERAIRLDIEKHEAQIRIEIQQQRNTADLEQRRKEELLRLEIQDQEFKQRNDARLKELELEDKEMASMVRMQIQMATASHEREMAKRHHDFDSEITKRRQELDAESRRQQLQNEQMYQDRKARLDEDLARMSMQERVMIQALAKGSLASSDLKDTMQSVNEAGWQTASDDKVRARAEAEAAKHNIETYKHAEDRERAQQSRLTGLSTDMMQAAKQSPSPTVVVPVGGASGGGGSGGGGINIVNTPAPQQTQPGAVRKCSACGHALQLNWKACPECGVAVAGTQLCGHCQKPVEPKWKVCAYCGTQI